VLSRLGCDRASNSGAIPARASTAQVAQFVGRERHLAALAEAFQSVKEGRTAVVCLLGGSGMGKSALARRFLEELRRREQVVTLQGRCYEQESVPYKGFDSIVDDLSQYLKSLPIREAEALIPPGILALTRMFPVLSWVEVIAAARRDEIEIPNSHERRKRAFAALRELLDRLAHRKPLVLFIDDLQWGDADSAALLTELLYPPTPPLLLIACYRSEEAETSPFLKNILPVRAAADLSRC
jgi:predicted ATPase